MAQLTIADLDDEIDYRLRRRALIHGRTIEAELVDILAAAAAEPVEIPPNAGLGTRISSRFLGIGLTEEERLTLFDGGQEMPQARS